MWVADIVVIKLNAVRVWKNYCCIMWS